MLKRSVLCVLFIVSVRAEQKPAPAPPAIAEHPVVIGIESSAAAGGPSQTIKAIADLAGALAWPAVFTLLILTQRERIANLLRAGTSVLQASSRIKISDFLDLEINQAVQEAGMRPDPSREVPVEQRQTATRISGLVSDAELPAIKERITAAAREYEATRANMPPGPERTRAMNAVMAKMRVMALAAKPLLSDFSSNAGSPGLRLAAIAILQMSPEVDYVKWLVDRMNSEQPFVFYHASGALLSAVRAFGSTRSSQLKTALTTALATVNSFRGKPDENTVETLKLALAELDGLGT